MILLSLAFIVLAAALIWFGSRLAIYADALADAWKLTRSWVGLLLVSLVTTLPEMATTVSSSAAVGSPDLAVGNVLGSVLFNLFILAICDAVFRRGGILRFGNINHALSASLVVFMMACLLGGLLFLPETGIGKNWRFGAFAPMVLVLTFGAFWLLYQFERRAAIEAPASAKVTTVERPLMKFLFSALGVVVCGYGLALTGDHLAEASGLSRTFIGSLFLAMATSLPELTVSFMAVRMGAYDLMLGNILGANLLNIYLVSLADFTYPRAGFDIPENLGRGHLLSGIIAIAAHAVIILVLVARPRAERHKRGLGPESLAIAFFYLLAMAAMFFGWVS